MNEQPTRENRCTECGGPAYITPAERFAATFRRGQCLDCFKTTYRKGLPTSA